MASIGIQTVTDSNQRYVDDRVALGQGTICTIMSMIVIVDKSEFPCNHLSHSSIHPPHEYPHVYYDILYQVV